MMGSRDNIAEHGKKTQFTSDNQPKNRGRKQSFLKKYMKEHNPQIGIEDVRAIFKTFLFFKSPEEIAQELEENKATIPVIIYGVMTAYIKDCERGRFEVLRWIHESVFGKADQKVEVTKNTDDITKLTRDELKQRLDILSQQINQHHRAYIEKQKQILNVSEK